jgi:uncharacterized UBP type Zn finger protein
MKHYVRKCQKIIEKKEVKKRGRNKTLPRELVASSTRPKSENYPFQNLLPISLPRQDSPEFLGCI